MSGYVGHELRVSKTTYWKFGLTLLRKPTLFVILWCALPQPIPFDVEFATSLFPPNTTAIIYPVDTWYAKYSVAYVSLGGVHESNFMSSSPERSQFSCIPSYSCTTGISPSINSYRSLIQNIWRLCDASKCHIQAWNCKTNEIIFHSILGIISVNFSACDYFDI